jgi:hypothetical protein
MEPKAVEKTSKISEWETLLTADRHQQPKYWRTLCPNLASEYRSVVPQSFENPAPSLAAFWVVRITCWWESCTELDGELFDQRDPDQSGVLRFCIDLDSHLDSLLTLTVLTRCFVARHVNECLTKWDKHKPLSSTITTSQLGGTNMCPQEVHNDYVAPHLIPDATIMLH